MLQGPRAWRKAGVSQWHRENELAGFWNGQNELTGFWNRENKLAGLWSGENKLTSIAGRQEQFPVISKVIKDNCSKFQEKCLHILSLTFTSYLNTNFRNYSPLPVDDGRRGSHIHRSISHLLHIYVKNENKFAVSAFQLFKWFYGLGPLIVIFASFSFKSRASYAMWLIERIPMKDQKN